MSVTEKLRLLFEAKATKNLEAGQAFLAENMLKPGIVSLESGLQYEIMVAADGPKPSATQTVNCHYHGTTIEGVVFDSSVLRGKPSSFPLNRVIKGWTEGVQLMSVGSKWRFFVPAHLAYGSQQVSAEIGPNSTLIFEVELLGIQ
jgi:FKBP-type peptidyl-prolyl cis-trans isomerase FklB